MKALAKGKRRMGCFVNRHNYLKAIIISINKEGNYSRNKRLGGGAKPRQGQVRGVRVRMPVIIGQRKRLKLLKFYAHQDRRDSPNRPRPTNFINHLQPSH